MQPSSIESYLRPRGLHIIGSLGSGKDGDVSETDQASAIKVFKIADLYHNELRAYQLLNQLSIDTIEGFRVPRLLGFDDHALLLEMTIVSPSRMLDFASCVDEVELEFLNFSEEVWAERETHWSESFGPDWPLIQAATATFLRLTGLTYLDPSPNNIRLR
jgi:hypothetical protein